jgi:hypothetical protein
MDGGSYAMYTMYTMNPSMGGGTPVIQILKREEYVKSLEHVICKVKKETANPAVDMDRR